MKKILKKIYLDCVKKQRVLVSLCALNFLITTILLTVIEMISVGRESFAVNHGEELNRGDLAIGFVNEGVRNLSGLDQSKIDFYQKLISMKEIDFTYEFICSNDENLFYVDSDTYTTLAPVIRFIDFSSIHFYVDEEINNISKNDIVLAQNITNRCTVNVDDSVYISPMGKVFPMKTHVSAIVSNREILIQDAVENSYIFADQDLLLDALGIAKEEMDANGYSQEAICFTLPTYFYIRGDEETQNQILSMLKEICIQNQVEYDKLLISTPNEASERILEVYGYMDVLLSIFSILNFVITCFSICYMVYIILVNYVHNFNILRILGLSKRKNALNICLTVMGLMVPSIILGIVLGYFLMGIVVRQTSLFGLMQLGFSEIIKASMFIVGVDILAIVIVTFITVACANKHSIVDILRRKNLYLISKSQIGVIGGSVILFIFITFASFTNISSTAVFLGAIIAIIIISYFMSLCLIRLLTFFRVKGRFGLSIYFFKRNSTKIALVTLPMIIAISVMYVIITMTSTLLAQIDHSLEKNMGYNMQIMTKNDGGNKLDNFLNQKGIEDYYFRLEKWCTIRSINDYPIEIETSASIYSDIPSVESMRGLEKGLILSDNLAKELNIKAGDMLQFETEYGIEERCVVEIYSGNEINNFSIAMLHRSDNHIIEWNDCYLLLKDADKNTVKEYINQNEDMIMLRSSKMLFGVASIFFDNKAVIYILNIFFFLGTFVLVLYSTIIIYQGRNREFKIYEVYGASKRMQQAQIDKECIFISAIISICGIISSVIFTYTIGKYSIPIEIDVKLLCLIIITALIVMFIASKIVKMILLKSEKTLSTILRQSI